MAEPTDQALRGHRIKASAVWSAIERSCTKEDFQPRPSRLCDYCDFRGLLPGLRRGTWASRPRLRAGSGWCGVSRCRVDGHGPPGTARGECGGRPRSAVASGAGRSGQRRPANPAPAPRRPAELAPPEARAAGTVASRPTRWRTSAGSPLSYGDGSPQSTPPSTNGSKPTEVEPALDTAAKVVAALSDHGLVWALEAAWRVRRPGRAAAGSSATWPLPGSARASSMPRSSRLVGRARPDRTKLDLRAGNVPVREPTSSSFPSGHTLAAFCTATVMADSRNGRWPARPGSPRRAGRPQSRPSARSSRLGRRGRHGHRAGRRSRRAARLALTRATRDGTRRRSTGPGGK